VAYELTGAEQRQTVARLIELRDRLAEAVLAVPGVELTGHPRDRLPGILSIIARDTDGVSVSQALDLEGFAVATGSACTTGSPEPSHVLAAMGYPDEESRGALRMSLGRTTTPAEVEAAGLAIPRSLAMLRLGAIAIAADPLGQAAGALLP